MKRAARTWKTWRRADTFARLAKDRVFVGADVAAATGVKTGEQIKLLG